MANILDDVAEQFNRKFHAELKYRGRLDLIPLCVDTEKFQPQDKARSGHDRGRGLRHRYGALPSAPD